MYTCSSRPRYIPQAEQGRCCQSAAVGPRSDAAQPGPMHSLPHVQKYSFSAHALPTATGAVLSDALPIFCQTSEVLWMKLSPLRYSVLPQLQNQAVLL